MIIKNTPIILYKTREWKITCTIDLRIYYILNKTYRIPIFNIIILWFWIFFIVINFLTIAEEFALSRDMAFFLFVVYNTSTRKCSMPTLFMMKSGRSLSVAWPLINLWISFPNCDFGESFKSISKQAFSCTLFPIKQFYPSISPIIFRISSLSTFSRLTISSISALSLTMSIFSRLSSCST